MSKYTVGIDLGTTNTVCFTYENKFIAIKQNRSHILPSVLLYKEGKVIIGEVAKNRIIREPGNVISSSKTFMADFKKKWIIDDRTFTPTVVAKEILIQVRLAAEKYFNTTEKISAVVTVPARFHPDQWEETKIAAEDAGFEVIQMLAEPVAAAVAYGLDEEDGNVFVVDIGGGTFDLGVVNSNSKKTSSKLFEVLNWDGDSKLGGDNFDAIIVEMCYSHLRTEYGIDFSDFESSRLANSEYLEAVQKIKEKSEQAKISLSESDEFDIDIANLCAKNSKPINFKYSIQREDFEKAALPLFNKIKRILNRFMMEINFGIEKINKVILVGGTSNIPYIKKHLNELFGKDKVCADKDLSKLVAMGAALYAAKDDNLVKIKIEDILSHSLGVASKNIRTREQRFSPLLPKNSKYPISVTKKYISCRNNKRNLKVKIYEGESKYLYENTLHGEFLLENFTSNSSESPIFVTFSLDENKVLHITVVNDTSGKSVTKEIQILKNNE